MPDSTAPEAGLEGGGDVLDAKASLDSGTHGDDSSEPGAGDANGADGGNANDGGSVADAGNADAALDDGASNAGNADADSGPSGTFVLVNHATGFLADVDHGSTSSGAVVLQWPPDNGKNQEWLVWNSSPGVLVFFNKNSNLVLDVAGTAVDQASPSGSSSQEWSISPSVSTGYYTIASKGGAGVLTCPSTAQGAQLTVSPPNPSIFTYQEWQLNPVP